MTALPDGIHPRVTPVSLVPQFSNTFARFNAERHDRRSYISPPQQLARLRSSRSSFRVSAVAI